MITVNLPSPPADLNTASPTDVDTYLSALYSLTLREQIAQDRAAAIIDRIYRQTGSKNAPTHRDQSSIDSATATINRAVANLAAINAAASPAEDRFDREQWTRAFLVNNSTGHVHKHMQCSTCFLTTEYSWLPELSGSDENTIVTLAGERACTVCYPTAPAEVLNTPTRLFTPSEKDAQQRREERAEKKVAADAKKLIDPRTGDLLHFDHETFKTERGAELAVIRELKALGWYGTHPDATSWIALANLVSYAKSIKHDSDPAAELATLVGKAASSARREGAPHTDMITDLTYTTPDGA